MAKNSSIMSNDLINISELQQRLSEAKARLDALGGYL
jgi:hypothetical protein